MVLQNNISALNARGKIHSNTKKITRELKRLSSGFRINSAADDAASLAISEKMRYYMTGLEQGDKNIEQGSAYAEIGDGALSEVHKLLDRAKELADQSMNGTYSESEREIMNRECQSLVTEIDRIAKYTQVNGNFPLNFEQNQIASGGPVGGSGGPGTGSGLPPVDFDHITLNASLSGDNALTSNGTLNLAGVTTDDYTGAAQSWQLVYRFGATSHVKFRVHTSLDAPGAPPTEFDIGSASADRGLMRDIQYTTIENADGTKSFTLTYHYTKDMATGSVPAVLPSDPAPPATDPPTPPPVPTAPANLLDLEISQTITVNNKAADGESQYYTISYGVKNNNSANVDVAYDFMHQCDTAYNNNDSVERYYVDGARVENSHIYEGDTDIPDSGFSIWGPTSELNFTGSVKYAEDGSKPDKLFLGHWSNETPVWDLVDHPDRVNTTLTPGTDLGFSMIWEDTALTGDAVSTHQLQFGIVSKEADVNIDPDDPVADGEMEDREPGIERAIQSQGVWIQAGADQGDGFYLHGCKATAKSLGVEAISIATMESAAAALTAIDAAVDQVSKFRGNFGADMNRLEHARRINRNSNQNLTAAESQIRDADMAKEMIAYTKDSILSQSSQAMLAQANSRSESVLSLIKG